MGYGKDLIYHYTSILGLYGIIGNKGIRFGEFQNANDPRETCGICEYKYISFTCDGVVEGWANPLMWYMYAHRYVGVCIAFDKNKLLQMNAHIPLEKFNIEYKKDKMPHVNQFGIEPMKYKSSVWAGENEFRIATNSGHEVLSINLDCIEHIYFLNPTPERYTLSFEQILTIGLKEKLTNIAFCNGDIITIPLPKFSGESRFILAPSKKIRVAVIGDEMLTEDEIYTRCKGLYDYFSNEMNTVCLDCINIHRKCLEKPHQPHNTPTIFEQ